MPCLVLPAAAAQAVPAGGSAAVDRPHCWRWPPPERWPPPGGGAHHELTLPQGETAGRPAYSTCVHPPLLMLKQTLHGPVEQAGLLEQAESPSLALKSRSLCGIVLRQVLAEQILHAMMRTFCNTHHRHHLRCLVFTFGRGCLGLLSSKPLTRPTSRTCSRPCTCLLSLYAHLPAGEGQRPPAGGAAAGGR